ncbi:hypothetical protein QVD17_23016 [Tagetes erecta]|uniref:Uncharacterized protein n=1 Tax=Tagetes erecta TaxID=13708 RepID=A0AAD8KGN9_TARER|nr:hypothetical protein QVD17_23016 [Tagetes erecta]
MSHGLKMFWKVHDDHKDGRVYDHSHHVLVIACSFDDRAIDGYNNHVYGHATHHQPMEGDDDDDDDDDTGIAPAA